MKLRNKLFGVWLGLELLALPLSLPAVAGLSQHFSFSISAQVTAQPIDAPQGVSRFLVASNAPFAVLSSGAATELNVSISQSGIIGGKAYGSAAQIPGEATTCSMPSSNHNKWRIYTSFDKTAARRGDVTQQSVLIEISYDPEVTLDFEIVTLDNLYETGTAYLAIPCSFTAS